MSCRIGTPAPRDAHRPVRPRAKVKEIAHPRFYLFDPGIARALVPRTRYRYDFPSHDVLEFRIESSPDGIAWSCLLEARYLRT